MDYLLLPALIALVAAVSAVALLAVRSSFQSARVAFAFLALLVSHGVVGLAVFIYKDLDANSYYAASTRIILTETIAALEQPEPTYLSRLKTFAATQPLTYESRGNLLENARRFAEQGKALRSEGRPIAR